MIRPPLIVFLLLFAGSTFGESLPATTPAELGLDEGLLSQARDFALSGQGSGCIVYRGRVVMTWGDSAVLHDLKSSSKAIGVTALGLALKDGKLDLDDAAIQYHPMLATPPNSNAATDWISEITIRHLANQTAGFGKPGGYEPLLFRPGTHWRYSDAGPNWLAECLTLIYRRDLNDVLFERVFEPIGITKTDLRWRKNRYRPERIDGIVRREFGSGFSANFDAMARIGLLYLHKGKWNDRDILPTSFVEMVSRPEPELQSLSVYDDDTHPSGPAHYSFLWWNNADGRLKGVPRDAFWAAGLYDSRIVVIPSLDLVVARAGNAWNAHEDEGNERLLGPIVAAVRGKLSNAHPPSPIISGIDWAPRRTILRQAKGSDNWPTTWADDGSLYTAYGDGSGFDRDAPKLSIGLAKLDGDPPDVRGTNLSAPSLEARGDGSKGPKASGILMIDGVLYILVRNVDKARVGWSDDQGTTWKWADWKFEESFGCPTFLNFGKNYAGARDEFVYIFSQDADSAYESADGMVMARVPKHRVKDQSAYEFFVRLDWENQPAWTPDIKQRGGVLRREGRCYRSCVSYHAASKRYLWCQVDRNEEHRKTFGFAVYDAPEPWGPWTTAYATDDWDVGPGETMNFPTKWMHADGRTLYLVFSGDDSLAIRKATLRFTEAER